jgi:hypothetical protein
MWYCGFQRKRDNLVTNKKSLWRCGRDEKTKDTTFRGERSPGAKESNEEGGRGHWKGESRTGGGEREGKPHIEFICS